MKRRVAVVALLVVALLLSGLPAGASSPAAGNSPGPQLARVAPVGGVLTNDRLKVANSDGTDVVAWVAAGSMVTGVDTPGGGAFKLGRFWVPGGILSSGAQHDRMQNYNVSTGVWSQDTISDTMLAGFPHADMAVCADPAAGGKIYAVNGHDNAFIYAALQVYNPAGAPGAKWTSASFPSYPDAVNCPTDGNCYFFSQASGCTVFGTKLFLYGGYAVVGDLAAAAAVTGQTWVYDIPTDTWSDYGVAAGTSMVTPRMWFGYGQNATTVFVAGGSNNLATFAPTATTERFRPAMGGWSAMGAVPAAQARLGPGVHVLGNQVYYTAGGTFNAGSGTFTPRNTWLRCANPCGAWAAGPGTLITARWFFGWASGNVPPNNRFYVGGGLDATPATLSSAEKWTAP